MNLEDLDKLWEGANLDKNQMKYLCRKYSPALVMEWIARGLSIDKKDLLIKWHKAQLKGLGEELMEKPPEVKDSRLFKEETGDYFSD